VVTDRHPGIARRRFIRTATGILFGGPAVLAACAPDSRSATDTAANPSSPTRGTDPAPTEASSTTESTGTAAPATTGPTTTTSSPTTAVVYRLSTRNQRAPCAACKAHAAHRFYATTDAAGGNRAHPGCRCAIVQQQIAAPSFAAWFDTANRVVFDDRWTT
jgi:hypothetical protein